MNVDTTQSKKKILTAVRNALHVSEADTDRRTLATQRLKNHPANIVPDRVDISRDDLINLFVKSLQDQSATVHRIGEISETPKTITDYLRQNNLPSELRMGEDEVLRNIPWDLSGTISITTGPAQPVDMVSLSRARVGAAETGTLFLTSGADNPTTLNFLPDTHMILIREQDIVGSYEEAWNRIRLSLVDGQMPRTVNLIGGPSRTADIEQTIIMGAHGPRRLLVIVVSD